MFICLFFFNISSGNIYLFDSVKVMVLTQLTGWFVCSLMASSSKQLRQRAVTCGLLVAFLLLVTASLLPVTNLFNRI